MVASVTTPADVVNQALQRIGNPLRVGSLFDGSVPAKRALEVFGQTRDELLRGFGWGFAERNAALTLLKWAPQGGYVPPNLWTPASNPPLPWQFEYAYPADCLRIRCLKTAPLFTLGNFDPMPNVFRIVNDNAFRHLTTIWMCSQPSRVWHTGNLDCTRFQLRDASENSPLPQFFSLKLLWS